MTILSIKNLTMSFGEDLLFENIGFDAGEGDKIGLIGVNGSGKTTLFNLITGENGLIPDSGEIVKSFGLNIGYMRQHTIRGSDVSAYHEVLDVFCGLSEKERELEKVHEEIDRAGENASEDLINRQMTLRESFELGGGLTYKNRAMSALLGLGFTKDDAEKPVNVLSGGEKSKLQLAKLLLSDADLLLLDEPTNHLDINALAWLENYLSEYRGAFITISHDRCFLDKVTNKTAEIENKRLSVYLGGYTEFKEKKAAVRAAAEKKYELVSAEIKRVEGIIEQQKRFNQAHNYVTIAHKQKSIDRLKSELVKPERQPEALRFNFKIKDRTGNDVLKAENIALTIGGRTLFKNIGIDIKKGERVFIIGANGVGKTSFLRVLIGEYKADIGEYRLGAGVELGYYDQTQGGLFEEKTVIDQIWDEFPKMKETEVRTALGTFLFSGDDVFKKISSLSGGERARVSLLSLMLKGPNLLLLDEPTNHLDITSREALENALCGYPGTLVIVSHDRYLINKLADKVYVLSREGLSQFERGEEYYIPVSNPAGNVPQNKPNEYKLKKERESEKRRLTGQLSRIEGSITALEERQAELNCCLTEPETSSDYEKVTEISFKLTEIAEKINNLMKEWEDISLKIEQI